MVAAVLGRAQARSDGDRDIWRFKFASNDLNLPAPLRPSRRRLVDLNSVRKNCHDRVAGDRRTPLPPADGRAIGILAFRGSAQARRARAADGAETGAVRDRLRTLGPAAYRHVRRGLAHDDGAACLSRADGRPHSDAPGGLLRRHGRAAQGARQHRQQGCADPASGQAVDPGARPFRHPSELRRAQ